MAVEAGESGTRQIVQVTWDKETVTGEIVVLHCVNTANGDVSVSGPSKNDGVGFVTYPQGYSGESVITVLDNDQNQDSGTIKVDGESAETVPPDPDDPLEIWGPDDPRPDVPIELPPGWESGPPIVLPPDLGFNPPDSEFPEHPEPIAE